MDFFFFRWLCCTESPGHECIWLGTSFPAGTHSHRQGVLFTIVILGFIFRIIRAQLPLRSDLDVWNMPLREHKRLFCRSVTGSKGDVNFSRMFWWLSRVADALVKSESRRRENEYLMLIIAFFRFYLFWTVLTAQFPMKMTAQIGCRQSDYDRQPLHASPFMNLSPLG